VGHALETCGDMQSNEIVPLAIVRVSAQTLLWCRPVIWSLARHALRSLASQKRARSRSIRLEQT